MDFKSANRTLILRGLACLLTLVGLVLLLAAVSPGTAAATEAEVPEAPRNLRASPGESGELVVSWEAPASDGGSAISGYKVQWKSGSEDYDWVPGSIRQATTGNDPLTYTISDLKDGTEYTVRVIATNGAGEGAPSTEATATPRPAPTHEGQPANPRGGSAEDGVYTWRDGDRIIPVRIETKRAVQGRTGRRSDGVGEDDYRTESIVSVSVGGDTMSLPGGVLVVLNPAWSQSRTGAFFSKNGIAPGSVSRLESMNNTFVVDTAPGLPSLRLANALATQDGVRVASPNWQMEVEAQQTPEQDDHGDTPDTATDLPLDTPVAGTLSSVADADYFRFELTESTFVVVGRFPYSYPNPGHYEVFDDEGNSLKSAWLLRIRLAAGTYYVRVDFKSDYGFRPDYEVEVKTIDDHGDTIENAAPLEIQPKKSRFILADFHSPEDVDYFKFEVDKPSWIKVYAIGKTVNTRRGRNFMGVNLDLFDSDGDALRPPIEGLPFEGRPYWLEAGTYYARFSPYIFRFSSGNIWDLTIAPYDVYLFEDADYTDFIAECSAIQASFSDPLSGCQWHLDNTATNSGTAGQDINVDSAWATTQGEGVNVVIVDDEISFDHEDLEDNWDPGLGYNYVEPEKEVDPRSRHGLGVAGIIAARDNNLGGRGVAPRTTVFGHNLLQNANLVNMVDAFTRNSAVTAVSNNSWMVGNTKGTKVLSQAWVEALETGVNEGFHGKGTFYAFAAGNSHPNGFHVNLNEGKNHYTQTLVCAVTEDGTRDELSETGYGLWLCAPRARFSTDLWNRYRNDFGGTSAATAVVSGVAALLRSANPDLTWRDLKLVLAASARNSDPANTGWDTGALKYGSDTDRYSYNPEYGFGVVDAGAAVELAANWTNLPPMLTAEARKAEVQRAIPDPTGGSGVSSISSRIELETAIAFTEFVEVRIDVNHPAFRDIGIELISPSGATSKLAVPDDEAPDEELTMKFRLGSARHLGEDPNGTWTLRVTDHYASEEGTFSGWELTVYGHSRVPVRPRILSFTSGSGQLEVTWAAPHGLLPDSYKVQWKEASGSWDAPGDVSEQVITGVLPSSFAITGLTDGVRYTVRVIASHSVGDSPPSVEIAATPGSNPATGLPTIIGKVHVGRILTVDTTGISDADGLANPSFSYQWLADDTAISEATGSTYTPVAFDEGRAIKVKVSFTDDGGNDETLTSAATALVGPTTRPDRPDAPTGRLDGAGNAFLDWNDVATATGYRLDLFLNGSWTSLPDTSEGIDVSISGSQATVTGLSTSQTDYYFSVQAFNSAGSSPVSPPGQVALWETTPTIIGTVQVGQTLTADTTGIADVYGMVSVSFTYQWLADDTDISGATGSTYTLTDSEEGKAIKVRVSVTDDGGQIYETLTSAATDAVAARPNSPATGAPTITGTVRLSETLTADTTGIADPDEMANPAFTYQWLADDTAIRGATRFTYTLVAADEGKAIKVRVFFTDDEGNDETLTSAATAAVAPRPNSPATGTPTIIGTAQVGETLTVDTTGIADPDGMENASFQYAWYQIEGDLEIWVSANYVSPAYPVSTWDMGMPIKVKVRFTDDWDNDEELSSEATGAVVAAPRGPDDPPETPLILGHTEIFRDGLDLHWTEVDTAESYDVELYRSRQTIVLPGNGFHIAFYGAGAVISGLDLMGASFRVRANNVHGSSDWSRRHFAPYGGDPNLYNSDRPANSPATGAPTVSGKAEVGETLTADVSGIADENGLDRVKFYHHWVSGEGGAEEDIEGATKAEYTVTEVDEGKAIRVRVDFTDRMGYAETLTSAPTDAVMTGKQPNSPATGAPAIIGTAQVGETLTADTSGIADADGLTNVSYTHQWITDDSVMVASAARSYTPTDGDKGKTIKVRVTFTDDGGNNETLTSAPTAAVEASANNLATGLPSIIGTAQVGETLTANTSNISDEDGLDNVAYTYRWLADDAEIAGATSLTYTLADTDAGKAISVQVGFTDDAGNDESMTSAATEPIEAEANGQDGNSPATGAPTIRGTTQVGETLTADITGIADADGVAGETFTYQWVSSDGTADTDIEKATASTYKLVAADQGKSIKVRVTFTDDGGREETLTSAASGAVLEEPVWGDGPPGAPGNLTVAAGDQELTLSWEPPADNGTAPATRYRIEWRMDGKDYKKGHWGTARKTAYTTKTDLANGVKYVFRVKAENGSGNSYGPYGPASEEVSATPTSGSAVDLATPVLSNTKTLHHGMVQLDLEDIEDAGWYVVQYYHVKSGEWLDLPAAGVDIAFHGSSAVVSNLHGLSWLRVRAMSCAGESEWSQIEELYGTKASDWEDVPVPEVAEGDQIDPCPVVLGTPVLSNTKTLHHGMVKLDWEDIEDAGWYVVHYYHVKSGEWLDLPGAGVDIAFHGSSAVVSDLHGLSWLRVRAVSCAGESEWSQIEELYGTKASDWEGVPVPEVAEGDQIEPCSEDADTRDNSPATGAPTISGTAQVGETLTANTSGIADADGLSIVHYEYQWLADDSEIAGATGLTYTLTDSEESKAITVRVSFIDDSDNEESLTSVATNAVAAAPQTNSPATGAPTISGTAQVGETLTADTSGIADADGLSNVQYEYQWIADDADISGATNATYTLAAEDEGKAIKVRVSFTDDAGNEEELTSGATDAVTAAPQPNSPATGAPTITGTAQVGEALTADTSGIADADGLSNVQYEYQWLADDTDISGATASTYTLVAADEGKAIQVKVSFTDDGGNSETLTSAGTDAVLASSQADSEDESSLRSYITVVVAEDTSDPDNPQTDFTITWSDTDTCSTGYNAYLNVEPGNRPGHETPGYQLDLGSSASDGALITKSLLGVQGSVEGFNVELYCGTYGSGRLVSTVEIPMAYGRPMPETYSSEPPLNALSVSHGTLTPAFNSHTFRYAVPDVANADTRITITAIPKTGYAIEPLESSGGRVGKIIAEARRPGGPASGLSSDCRRSHSDALGQLIELTDADPDTPGFQVDLYDGENHVYVSVYPIAYCILDTGYALAITRAEGSVSLPRPNRPAIGAPTISGAPLVGRTLNTHTSEIRDRDGLSNATFKYQWLADDADISEATNATYTLADADEGKAIKVEVSFTDDAGNGETLTSAATDAVAAASTPNSPATKAYITVVIASGDDTVSWSDPGGCSSDYNIYKAITPSANYSDTSHIHLVSAAPGSTQATLDISHSEDDQYPAVEVELYCGTYDAASSQNLLISSTQLSIGGTSLVGINIREGTYSSAPLTALTISSGMLSPDFDRGLGRYSAEVPSDVEVITLDPTVLTGYQTDFVKNPGLYTVTVCPSPWNPNCVYSYGDGTTTGIVLSDAEPHTEGFQINLDRGENRLGIGVHKGPAAAEPAKAYPLTITRAANTPATGRPTISGTAQVGQTLTADTSGISDADGLTNATFRFSYQWLSSRDTEIGGATSSTYALQPSDEGKAVKVRVTFTDDAGNNEKLTSPATDAVAAAPTPNTPATGAPTITGTAQVGETLTANTSEVADADGLSNVQYEYQWFAEDADIAGATGLTYTLTDGEESKAITVLVSFTDDAGNAETLTSAATDEVDVRPNSPATGAPTISGTAQVGETLTADTSGIADADGLSSVQYEYQWLADDFDISGATSLTYTLADTDEGKSIKVEVTFTDDAGNEETLTSAATDAVAAAPQTNNPATGAPTINGTAQVGETLTANTSGVADADGLSNVQYEYQWLANDSDISGATNATYTLAAADEGKAIKVQVSFTDDADNEESLTSAATDEVAAAPTSNSPATGAPTISGTAQVGETLEADTSGIADVDGLANAEFAYQWLADDAEIAGANGSTYTLPGTDEGKAIEVEVTFTDDAGNYESLTSAATDAVAAAEPAEPPDKPKGLEATATHGQVVLTWDDPEDDSITGYVILRRVRVNDQGGDFSVLVADTGSAATSYTDDEVAASTTYTYRIKAINEHGVSERSRWYHIDTPAAPIPAKPTGLSATATHDSVTLTWDDPQTRASPAT